MKSFQLEKNKLQVKVFPFKELEPKNKNEYKPEEFHFTKSLLPVWIAEFVTRRIGEIETNGEKDPDDFSEPQWVYIWAKKKPTEVGAIEYIVRVFQKLIETDSTEYRNDRNPDSLITWIQSIEDFPIMPKDLDLYEYSLSRLSRLHRVFTCDDVFYMKKGKTINDEHGWDKFMGKEDFEFLMEKWKNKKVPESDIRSNLAKSLELTNFIEKKFRDIHREIKK